MESRDRQPRVVDSSRDGHAPAELEALFHSVLDVPADRREGWIEERCANGVSRELAHRAAKLAARVGDTRRDQTWPLARGLDARTAARRSAPSVGDGAGVLATTEPDGMPRCGSSQSPRRRALAAALATVVLAVLLALPTPPAAARAFSKGDEMNETSKRAALAAFAAAASIAASATAQDAVQWRVEDGGNGHWYFVDSTDRAWSASRVYAESIGGHLATLTTQAEHEWVTALPDVVDQGCAGPAIGLTQSAAGAEPNQGWAWVTGEPLAFTAWGFIPGNAQQPDDNVGPGSSNADRGAIWCAPWSDWEDVVDTPDYTIGALIEWSADCNNDGIVDFGQIRAGELVDANANNIPDCCESGTDCIPNLLVNGGFEIGPAQTDCTWVVHDTSSTFVPGWSVAAVSVDRERLSATCPIGTESWTSFAGEFTVDLDGGSAGGAVAQTIATQIGRTYRLSFQLTGNCTTGDKPMRVEVGSNFWVFVHSCQATNPQPWNEKSVEFVAMGPSTTIVLRSLMTDGRNGPVVDAVRLEEILQDCPGDLDRSGEVNGVDLAIILQAWGGSKQYPEADIDGDGTVGGTDLAVVLNSWGECP